MRTHRIWIALGLAVSFASTLLGAGQGGPAQPAAVPLSASSPLPMVAPSGTPAHVVDLMTTDGVALFNARWRYMDVKFVEVPPREGAGPRYKSAWDVQPHAGPADFDDSAWPVIEPKALNERRGGGRLFMGWYRTHLTIPARVGAFDTAASTAVFHVTVDDYAEVWVNGQLPRRVGMPSPNVITGFNMPNRVVISQAVKAGETVQIAVFGINGPISLAPENPLFIREARVEFFK
jgi:gluconolactonase